MPAIKRFRWSGSGCGWKALLTGALLCAHSLSLAAGVDPQAEALLRKATDYLSAQGKFSVDATSTIEAVLHSGQKIQFDHATTLTVRRPDRLRAERRGDLVDQVFYYDGASLTLYNPDDRHFATLPAPATLEEALDLARESLDIVAPAGDLVYSNAFEILMQDVTEGFVVGKSVVEGVLCDQLAFRAPHVDWQIWIQADDEPLPRKMVITSRDVLNQPQFTVRMTRWDMAPAVDDGVFAFAPPADAQGVEFLQAGSKAAASP